MPSYANNAQLSPKTSRSSHARTPSETKGKKHGSSPKDPWLPLPYEQSYPIIYSGLSFTNAAKNFKLLLRGKILDSFLPPPPYSEYITWGSDGEDPLPEAGYQDRRASLLQGDFARARALVRAGKTRDAGAAGPETQSASASTALTTSNKEGNEDDELSLLDSLYSANIAFARVFHVLPTNSPQLSNCQNTWLAELCFKSALTSGESQQSHGPQVPSPSDCSCHAPPKQREGLKTGHDKVFPFTLQLRATLWNEDSGKPVCYQDPEEPRGAYVMSLKAEVPFRMPASLLNDFSGLPARSPPPSVSCLVLPCPEVCKAVQGEERHIDEACKSSCNAFFNEFLLAINNAMQELFMDGNPFYSDVKKFTTLPQMSAKGKWKGKGKGARYVYSDPKMKEDLPPLGTFKPAKLLFFDTSLSNLSEMCFEAFKAFTFDVQSPLKGPPVDKPNSSSYRESMLHPGSEQKASSHDSQPASLPRDQSPSAYCSSSSSCFDTASATSSSTSSSSKSTSCESVPDKGLGGASFRIERDFKYGRTVLDKQFYSKTWKQDSLWQYPLICKKCGIVGVDKAGTLPWPKMKRCSRCKTAW